MCGRQRNGANGAKKMSIKPKFSSEMFYSRFQDAAEEGSNSRLGAESETVLNSSTTISEQTAELVEEIPKPKRELKKLTWGQDSYEGSVLLNNLHGSGFYFAQRNGEKFFYDGLFYANKLEGYGQVFYENGTHFQGLFQKHRRFGPGVLTHPDGTQDVGFWNGFLLSRLVCVIGGNSVPSLASSAAGKTKLLCSKYMVPLNQNENDLVRQALDNLGAGADEGNADFDGVFNEDIRNPNSLFFHTQLFDEHFFGRDNCTIKVSHQDLADEEEEEEEEEQEEEMSSVDGQAVERMENLERKIREVNETLQTFIVIRQSLDRKVYRCRTCCRREVPVASTQHQLHTSTQAAQSFPAENSLQSLEVVADVNMMEDIEDVNLSASIYAQLAKHSDACACAEEEGAVDLQNLEEQLQNIWSQEIFYRNIRGELAKKLERLVGRMSSKPESGAFQLVHVNEVWAWNNENSLISMQKHTFRHRNSEDMVNFSVPSLILGNRKEFGAAGAHEEIAQKFLMACYKGKKEFVSECLRSNKVDANLSDSRGNSGMFFAAANNQQDIIAILTNFGAKVDQLNDEQLTPLSLCLLKYIAQKNSCKDWEKAFLPGSERCDLPELPKWYDLKSFQSSTASSSKTSTCPDEGSNQQPCSNLRIIDLLRKISNFDQTEGGLRSSRSSAYVFDLSCNSSKFAKQTQLEPDLHSHLESIQLTIMTLLDYGASPSGCEVPHPPLVLSLFTENADLVKEMIKANADIDVVMDGNVSCLHIAASLNPSLASANICRIIVKYGCNPNAKTSPNHWIDRKCGITGKVPESFQVADDGKNVLHLLCMRTDFESDQSNYFCAVAKILLETNLDLHAMYLGHTPLSLAALVGNVKLVQCLLRADAFDPYKQLGYGMGNILTIFALKRFENALPLDKCKAVLTALFEAGLNVLANVANSENVTAFVEDEDTFFDALAPKAPRKEPRDKAKNDKHYATAVKEFLRSLGRQTIIKQVQMEVTYLLFELTEEGMLNSSEIFATLASVYLTPEVLLQNLKKLFEYGKIEHDRLDKEHVKTVLEFVNTHKKAAKAKAKTAKKSGPTPQDPDDAVETLFQEFERTLNLRFIPPKNLPLPGLDEPQKYLICYHCLRGQAKTLKVCPRCQMVFFCSSQCNKSNSKLKTLHTCNVLFYDMGNGEQAVISKGGVSLRELAEEVRQKCAARLSRMRESKLEEEERKLLQMWRADTYGTKFLQIKPLMEKAATKKKGKQLNWNLGLLQGLMERNFRKHPGDTSLYSLENLLIKLHGKDWFRILGQKKSDGTIRTKQSWSTRRSTLGGSTLHSMIFQLPEPEEKLKRKSCKCLRKIARSKSTAKAKAHNEPKHEDDPNVNEFEVFFRQAEERPVIRKLKKIPARYQKFVEIVATYFPEIDISQWLLPYACCSGGQLFYRFCYNNDVFKESYSFT